MGKTPYLYFNEGALDDTRPCKKKYQSSASKEHAKQEQRMQCYQETLHAFKDILRIEWEKLAKREPHTAINCNRSNMTTDLSHFLLALVKGKPLEKTHSQPDTVGNIFNALLEIHYTSAFKVRGTFNKLLS